MKSNKSFVIAVLSLAMIFSCIAAIPTIIVDPFFHYHKPLKKLSYELFNQRSQNNGIIKHFDYDVIITGTSMTENFKASEANKLFNVKSIKVPFSGASFKEINDNLTVAFNYNRDIKKIIRGLDLFFLCDDKNQMNWEAKSYPTYLYNKNPFDDVKYLFNSEVLNLSIKTIFNQTDTTDFDHYSYWMPGRVFGKNKVLANVSEFKQPKQINKLTENTKQTIIENIEQNIKSLPKIHPDCTFYYFFPPPSALWWGKIYESGDIEKQIEIEKTAIEAILVCENVKLFSFNNEFDLTTNLNNYKDEGHYGEWINSLMLEYMAQDKCLLTKDNYLDYLEKEKEFYSTFDYNSLFDQIDEEDRPCDLQ